MMTIIKGKGFVLRPITLNDTKSYFESMQDPLTKKGFMSVPKNIEEAKEEIKKKIIATKNKTGESFAIEIDGEYAGYVELHDLNEKFHEHKGSIGYCLHPKFRGRGITAKAVKVLTEYAFKKYKLKRISGWCRTFNKASAKTLENAGFKLEGILRKNKWKEGKYLDDMVWAIVR
jgi:ribosomal-protein-alanine N-acetyltransferase